MAHTVKLTRVGSDIKIEVPGDDTFRTLDARVAELFFGEIPGMEGQFLLLDINPKVAKAVAPAVTESPRSAEPKPAVGRPRKSKPIKPATDSDE